MENIQADLHRFLFGEGAYYNWGIALLRRAGCDLKELAKLERYCTEPYAPIWAEDRVKELLRGYYRVMGDEVMSDGVMGDEVMSDEVMGDGVMGDRVIGDVVGSDEPAVIQSLRAEMRLKLKLRADWHSQMCHTKTQGDRAHCAEQVMNVTAELDRIYAAIDNFKIHHIIPPMVVSRETSGGANAAEEVADLMREEKSVAPRVSKIRSLLRGTDLKAERRKELEAELVEKEERLRIIKLRINQIL